MRVRRAVKGDAVLSVDRPDHHQAGPKPRPRRPFRAEFDAAQTASAANPTVLAGWEGGGPYGDRPGVVIDWGRGTGLEERAQQCVIYSYYYRRRNTVAVVYSLSNMPSYSVFLATGCSTSWSANPAAACMTAAK